MKSILEALQTKKIVSETLTEITSFVCGICGDRMDYKDLPEHAQMTGHNDPRPLMKVLK